MEILSARIKKISSWSYLPFILAFIFYAIVTFYYTPISFTKCTDTINGFGDSTAGLIWPFTVSNDSPLRGYESVTNYPFGENLRQPINWSISGLLSLHWGIAKIVGPICAYNLINIGGYLSTAMLLFGFLFWLTKRPFISWLIGYIVSFTPYLQMKVGGHPTYGYMSIIILIFWLSILAVFRNKLIYKIMLPIVAAIACYFDPYFILFTLLTLFSVLLAYIFTSRKNLFFAKIRDLCKKIWLPIIIFLLFLVPLSYIYFSQQESINKVTSESRGSKNNIVQAAILCSNFPQEYVIPNENNYILNQISNGEYKETSQKGYQILGRTCGVAEDGVYLSVVVTLSVLSLIVIYFWEKIAHNKIISFKYVIKPKNINVKYIFMSLGLLALLALILALPAYKFLNIIPMPSRVLIDITSVWRIISRLYLISLFALSIIAGLSMSLIASKIKNKKILVLLFVILFMIVFCEYQISKPLSANPMLKFSYSKDVPNIYKRLAQKKDVNVIAEYPLERIGETDVPVYYLTMQQIHKKNILNSNYPDEYLDKLRFAIKDLSDPQTLGVLKGLGIDYVMVHGVDPDDIKNIPGLTIIDYDDGEIGTSLSRISPIVSKKNASLVRISDDIRPLNSFIGFDQGVEFYLPLQKDSTNVKFQSTSQSVKLAIHNLPDKIITNREYEYCFDISSRKDNDEITISDDSGVLTSVTASNGQQNSMIIKSLFDKITIESQGNSTMLFDNLGCRD